MSNYFNINDGISDNLNRLTRDARNQNKKIPDFKNRAKNSILEYLKYYEDNKISNKNKDREGLECIFKTGPAHHFKDAKEVTNYILKETKDVKFKRGTAKKSGEQPIECWVTTLNQEAVNKCETDDESKELFDKWVEHELNFLKEQGYDILCYFIHFGEDSPHLHIVTRNWYDRDFIYTNQERNADGSKKEWKQTRRICGNEAKRRQREANPKNYKESYKKLKNDHLNSLKQWIKQFSNQKINKRGEENTLLMLRHRGKDALINKLIEEKEVAAELLPAILKQFPDLNTAGMSVKDQAKLNEIKAYIDKLKEENKKLKAENTNFKTKEAVAKMIEKSKGGHK